MSANLINALTTIITLAAVGAFIDFWLGKAGQERVRKWLEHTWLVLSEVRLSNFGRKEAGFAVKVIDASLGTTLSLRRFYISLGLLLFGLLFSVGLPVIWSSDPESVYQHLRHSSIAVLIVCLSIVLFNLTVSITRLIAHAAEAHLPETTVITFIYAVALFAVQYALSLIGGELVGIPFSALAVRSFISQVPPLLGSPPPFDSISYFHDSISALVDEWSWWPYARFRFSPKGPNGDSALRAVMYSESLSMIVNLSRLCVAALFLGSFMLRPVQSFIMTLWVRLVESDKPVFTLVLGGLAVLLKSIQEVVRVFGAQ